MSERISISTEWVLLNGDTEMVRTQRCKMPRLQLPKPLGRVEILLSRKRFGCGFCGSTPQKAHPKRFLDLRTNWESEYQKKTFGTLGGPHFGGVLCAPTTFLVNIHSQGADSGRWLCLWQLGRMLEARLFVSSGFGWLPDRKEDRGKALPNERPSP